ncbi:unnamed protein product [Malus baccata var. baccata]
MYRDVLAEDDGTGKANLLIGDENFKQKVEEAEAPLYEGCTKYTKLSATVVLYKIKASNGATDKLFDELLQALKDMFPEDFEQLETCPKCGSSRWQVGKRNNHIYKGVSAKVLSYFPIIPRFKRMFKDDDMAKDLTWHHTNKSQDGKMRHPVDSPAWESIDTRYPDFASDPRNLRLGLATDGFNPFRQLSSRYSCWPVILVTYNLPPWLAMSKENLMLTLIIPGKKQPGNDIDVYLQPLIEDLCVLWNEGVGVFDATTNSTFNLRAILMWTISDYPAYGNLAGCFTKGRFACVACGANTRSLRLPFSKKHVYTGNRRFLPPSHEFRKKGKWFDGNDDIGQKPRVLTGEEVLYASEAAGRDWGKKSTTQKGTKRKMSVKKGVQTTGSDPINIWKKKSIFFDLPYWKKLCLRHNLDIMHIEKNVCESIVGTLLHIKDKSKDGLNCRKDLKELGIRHDLCITEEKGKKTKLPPALYNFSKAEKHIFCKRLFDMKVPDGYSSNISNCVDLSDCNLIGLKFHDCHVLMQQLLPVAIRGLLPKGPRHAIFRLCVFFHELCLGVIDKSKLEVLENEVAETICMLEKYFPPSFFDIMIHLTIHLAREARLCGPVHYRWMYPFERFMKVLKDYVRNRARPEGSMVECVLADECVKFCSKYIKQAENIGLRHNRYEDESIVIGNPISAGVTMTMSSEMYQIAHRYILFNSSEAEPYREMHVEELKYSDPSLVGKLNKLHRMHATQFSSWLRNKVIALGDTSVSDMLKGLAFGPITQVMSYSRYVVNGRRFCTRASEKTTQDSGVYLEAETSVNGTEEIKKVLYYGVIQEILVMDYYTFRVPIFKCDWANTSNGIKVDDGFTLVNLHRLNQFQNDPFILASQAKQVFYSRESETSDWYVVLKAPPKGFHDLGKFDEDAYMSYAALDVYKLDDCVGDEDEGYVRADCEAIPV